ncbi:MAG: hypothetical protein ACI9F2_000854 [Lysobacterales bacterium]|jgi:hypothetical protein
MMPVYHITISSVLGVIFITWLNSWEAALVCLGCGVLIDLDHHLDYFIATKKLPFKYKELKYFCMTDKNHKLYLFFHTYEGLILLWLCIYYFNLDIVWLGAAVGLSVHLICDQLHNPMKALTYFFVYRVVNNFDKRKLYATDFYKKMSSS